MRVLLLPHGDDDLGSAKAIRRLLREPSRASEGKREIGRGEGVGQPWREEGGEVVPATDRERPGHIDESPLDDRPSAAPPRAVGRMAPNLVDIDQDDVNLEAGVEKQGRDADQLSEDIARSAVPR